MTQHDGWGPVLASSAVLSLALLGDALIYAVLPVHAARVFSIAALTRMQAWRDLGAAIGPLVTGFAPVMVSPESLHGLMAILTMAALVHWWRRA